MTTVAINICSSPCRHEHPLTEKSHKISAHAHKKARAQTKEVDDDHFEKLRKSKHQTLSHLWRAKSE